MAYQAELEEDMTAKPDTTLWEDICVITDHVLRLHKVAIQATGRAMGLKVLQERARWLRLTNLMTKEKEELLVTPIIPRVSCHPYHPSGSLWCSRHLHAKEM